MSSLFSFLRPEAEPPGEEPPTEPVPGEASTRVAPRVATATALTANSASTPDQALANMLAALKTFLDELPDPSVSVTSVAERALAIGNWRGTERRGSFAVVALKGGRLDAGVRFQFLADTLETVDSAVETLQKRLLAAKDDLWAAGFLRFAAEETSLAEHISTLDAWRKTADYRVLYEFHYQDTDGAESIIARIPIHSDLEEHDSLQRETTIVTDEIVRWDNEEAPPLEVAASAGVNARGTGLAILAYLPAGWTGNQITLARLDRGSTNPPTIYPTLTDFHTAVTDPVNPDRHAQVTFVSVAEFLAVFDPSGDPITLGDWDEDGTSDQYQPGILRFDPPIRLETGNDLIRLSYTDSAFDTPAVVYLRAEARGV
ncbi:MAG: hypothetical protein P8186_14430 [Anaerolineae bacterium]